MTIFKSVLLLFLAAAVFLSSSCARGIVPVSETETGHDNIETGSIEVPDIRIEQFGITSKDSVTTAENAMVLDFSGEVPSSDAVSVNGDEITIKKTGDYILRGSSDSKTLTVALETRESVHLILDGLTLSSAVSAPITVRSASKVILTVREGTENRIEDRRDAKTVSETDETEIPNAAIWSKEDLTVNGTGKLTVDADYDAGILSKDCLKLLDASVSVRSAGAGIKGKDALIVRGAVINAITGGDGMKSTETEKEESGIVQILSGNITLQCGGDGISSSRSVMISGGTIDIKAGNYTGVKQSGDRMYGWGGPGRNEPKKETDAISKKGIKSDNALLITGGEITIVSEDDALHSANELLISDGTLSLTTGDDGIHSDNVAEIRGGQIDILNSYEGIEGKTIRLYGGHCTVISADDGINASDGSSSGGMGGFFADPHGGNASDGVSVTVTGGFWYINASGDGFDSNDSITMTGGTLLVCGPTDNGNGPIDYERSFQISGGILVACGSAGMAMLPSDSSEQCSVMIGTQQNAGTAVTIRTSAGKEILTFVPVKNIQTFAVSAPDLKKGETVTVLVGSVPAGEGDCGLYFSSSGGKELTRISLDSINTSWNFNSRGPGMKDPGRMPGRK